MVASLAKLLFGLCVALAAEMLLAADAVDQQASEFFESQVRPLLVDRCFKCHGDGDEPKANLRLNSRAAILAGGDSGPAAVPQKPKESLLVEAVEYHDGLKMPPDAKLPEADIQRIARWVELGLPWPGGGGAPATAQPATVEAFQISEEQRRHWAFQPVRASVPPAVGDAAWPLTAVDAFVLDKLNARGFTPNPPADKRTLLRRVTFDLTGLPPTPAELQEFLADESPTAFERVVERLLASPRYGERWARHWLDVVRYADTAGETADYPVPQAYRYRDYVIDAFNADKPYDEFIREQIAGDILAKSGPSEVFAERITATGFIAISRRFGFDPENYHHLTIADTLDVMGRTVLGLSIGCARCHDHKYDPISMSDYYALYGIFDSTRYAFPGSEEKKRPRDFVALLPEPAAAPLAAAHQARLAELDAKLKELEGQAAEIDKQLKAGAAPAVAGASGQPIAAEELKARQATLKPALDTLRREKDALVAAGPYEQAYAVIEGEPHNAKIQKRGEPTRPGAEVPRRFIEILGGDPVPAAGGSGRRELADWLTRPSNPLTARVMVNRVWQYHFGRGLVASSSDFGLRGREPSHPELLDYLADRFMRERWSIKSLHRELLLSRVYQQSSSDANPAAATDPGNELWWKFDRRRLEAEAIRDAILAMSGQVDWSRSGPHPFPPVNSWGFTQHGPFKAVYPSDRRSIYLMTQRIQRHPFLGLFDGADANVSTAQRLPTTTPTQALFLMNDPFVHTQSVELARRLEAEAGPEPDRVRRAVLVVLGREAQPGEVERGLQFVERYSRQAAMGGSEAGAARAQAWAAYMRTLLASNEFVFVD